MESMVYMEDGSLVSVRDLPSTDPRYWNPQQVEKTVDQNLPIFNLPIKEVLLGLGQFGIQVPDQEKIPGFFLEMSLSQMLSFAKSVTFADLQKMIPPGIIDQFKSKLGAMSEQEVTQQIKDLIQQVH